MFCENCGHSIPDGAAQCRNCSSATGNQETPLAAATAAANEGSPIPPADGRAPSLLTRAEQSVYFRLARGFSWFLLLIISAGIVVLALLIAPVLSQVMGTSTRVSSSDLLQLASSSPSSEGGDDYDLNPAEMAELDKTAYEIIQLFPADARTIQSVDYLRRQIKDSAENLARERKEQMVILQELRDDLRAVEEPQRGKALGNYFLLKRQKIQLDRSRKEGAKASLLLLGSSMLSGIALLTFITMILVLLSIERNTRGSIEWVRPSAA